MGSVQDVFCCVRETRMNHSTRRGPAASLAFVLALAVAVAGLAADRTLSASGTIMQIDAKTRTVVVAVTDGPKKTFGWNADTKISGTLSPGARVTIRYIAGDDGRDLALQISVSRG